MWSKLLSWENLKPPICHIWMMKVYYSEVYFLEFVSLAAFRWLKYIIWKLYLICLMIKVAQETQNAWGFNIQKIRSYKYADKLFNSPHTVRRSAMYSYRRPIAIIAIRLICNIHSHSFSAISKNINILIILSHLFCLKTLIFKVERSPMNPVLKTKSHSHNWKISQKISRHKICLSVVT